MLRLLVAPIRGGMDISRHWCLLVCRIVCRWPCSPNLRTCNSGTNTDSRAHYQRSRHLGGRLDPSLWRLHTVPVPEWCHVFKLHHYWPLPRLLCQTLGLRPAPLPQQYPCFRVSDEGPRPPCIYPNSGSLSSCAICMSSMSSSS